MRVLVIEDSAPTRDLLVRSLTDAGMTVVIAARASSGLRLASTPEFDVIVLDLMLPDGDGLDVCRQLRANDIATPILCLTARAEVGDRVQGLDAGADDYLRKPFALAELHARIRALARRSGRTAPGQVTIGTIHANFAARRFVRGGQEIPLTAREWEVFEFLLARAGRVVSRGDLLEFAWHEATLESSDSLDVILSRLRRKLGDASEAGCAIRTVRGEGFIFERAR